MSDVPELRSLGFFAESPAEVRQAMEGAARMVVLPAGDVFFRESQPCPHFAVVHSGDLRVFKADASGHELTLYHVRDGEACMVNLLCVTLGAAAMATARAEAETSAIAFPGELLDAWIAASPAVRRFVHEAFASRIVGVMALAEEIAFRHVDMRLASLLLARFREDRVINATHDEIASELGTAREVVSRAIGELARRGAIRASRGRIELIDEAPLRRIK
jgi:CRP/FNR family transcriptional regulator